MALDEVVGEARLYARDLFRVLPPELPVEPEQVRRHNRGLLPGQASPHWLFFHHGVSPPALSAEGIGYPSYYRI